MNIQQMGRYYIDTPAYEVPANMRAAFRQFIIDLAQVELQGVDFQYVDFQPYFRGPNLCLEDVYTDFNQGRLMITTQFNESDLLDPEINMLYRCIHEVHHLKLNVDFDWQGECATAAHLMSFTQNSLFQQIIFSEIVGQVAVWMSGGQFPERQKVVLFEPKVWHGLYKDLGITHLAAA